jgi:hypothetical protein
LNRPGHLIKRADFMAIRLDFFDSCRGALLNWQNREFPDPTHHLEHHTIGGARATHFFRFSRRRCPMYVVPTQATFNAAFLLEIKEDNRRLRELFCEAAELLLRPSYVRPKEAAHVLAALRDQLAMHFALENAYGYLADVVDYAPRLCDRAHAMLAEHDTLFVQCAQLVDRAESIVAHETRDSGRRRLAWEFFEFQRKFQDHESRENALIMDAFEEDIGVGD